MQIRWTSLKCKQNSQWFFRCFFLCVLHGNWNYLGWLLCFTYAMFGCTLLVDGKKRLYSHGISLVLSSSRSWIKMNQSKQEAVTNAMDRPTNQLATAAIYCAMNDKIYVDYNIYHSHFHRPSHPHYMHRHTQQIVCLHILCRFFVVSDCNICLSIYDLHVSFRLWSVYYILTFCSC